MPVIRCMNFSHTHYISPLGMLDTNGKTSFDKKDFLLAKKKMLAELELSGETTVNINGKELSKNDIVIFFDQLQQTENLAYHQAVAEDKVLLHFLEGVTKSPTENLTNNQLYWDPRFIDWISPYFYTSYCNVSKDCFKTLNTQGWAKLMSYTILMNLRYREKTWMFIEGFTEQNIEQLKELHESGKSKNPDSGNLFLIETLCDYRLVNMMVQLPEERFASQRDEYAFSMMQVLIDVFNTCDKTYAMEALKNAEILAHSGYMQQQLLAKYNEMQGISREEHKPSSGTGKNSEWGVVRLLFFALFILIKLATCDDYGSKKSYDFSSQIPVYSPSSNSDFVVAEPVASDEERMPGDMNHPTAVAMKKFANIIFEARYSLNEEGPLVTLKTGDDPYKDLWSKVYSAKGGESPKQVPFIIENKGYKEAIIFIATGKKVSAVFVTPKEKISTYLTEGDNTIIPYIGQQFKTGPVVSYPNPSNGKKIKITGLFTEGVAYNLQWLNRPMNQNIKPGSTAGGHMEIYDGNTMADVYLFNN
jgi:hypothetical protein